MKRHFWEEMNGLIRETPITILGGDLTGHAKKDSRGYETVHAGQGFRERNGLLSKRLSMSLSLA